jgi:hypothetical protein
MTQKTTEPDWVDLARESIEAHQRKEIRQSIEHFADLIKKQKARNEQALKGVRVDEKG